MMNNTPLLSVIVPVYNVAPYLERCLESILSQTYDNLEVICVNDGSTDGSLAILEEYQLKDRRVRLISKENGGLVSARKAGINIASGDYATYVDSDDYIDHMMYEVLMGIMIESEVDVVTSGCFRDYGSSIVTESEEVQSGKYCGKERYALVSQMIDTKYFFRYNLSCHLYNKIYRTQMLRKFQNDVPDEITIGEDAAVVYPLILNATSIYVSGYDFYHYCIRPDSVMGTMSRRDKDPVYIMLSFLSERMSIGKGASDALNKQFFLFSLYVRLLRNPYEVLKYEDGFLYPFGNVGKKDRIVLYGAGKFGVALKGFLDDNGFENILWVDQNSSIEGTISWNEVENLQIDKIIVGTLVYATTKSALEYIRSMGYSGEKVLSINGVIDSLEN